MKTLALNYPTIVPGFIPTTLCSLLLALTASQAAEFIPLGDLAGGENYSAAYDLSGDGTTVLGASSSDLGLQLFRWTTESGFQLIPAFDAEAISGDGTVVVGALETDRLEAARWSAPGGLATLGVLSPEAGFAEFSAALDASSDGSTIVGVGSTLTSPFSEALLWNASVGILPLGFLADDFPEPGAFSLSYANAVSADGQVVAGASASTKHLDRAEQAFRWTSATGMQPLGFLPGAVQSQATAVSADGSVIAGISGAEAFRWTESTGLQPIGMFLPTGISADGNLVVGRAETDLGTTAFIWTSHSGAAPLRAWLEQAHALSLEGWLALTEAVGVSDDGLTIAGTGVNASGLTEGFLVSLEADIPLTSASVALSGSAQLLIVDAAGLRFGTDPKTGASYSEIPEVTVTLENGVATYAWPGLFDGTYQFHLFGVSTGDYELRLNFTHADAQTSGQTLISKIGAGGLHIISANLVAASPEATQITQTYADSDGDKVLDASDAILFSDLRSTVFIGSYNTGLPNRVLTNGASLNDIVARFLNQTETRQAFVSKMQNTIMHLSAKNVLTGSEKRKLVAAMLKVDFKACKRTS